MKSNLEQNFKDAFEQYELPYNETSWQSLNKKLNHFHGENTSPISSPRKLKWLIGGGALLIVAVTVFTILHLQNNDIKTETTLAKSHGKDVTNQQQSNFNRLEKSEEVETLIHKQKGDRLIKEKNIQKIQSKQTSINHKEKQHHSISESPTKHKEVNEVSNQEISAKPTTSLSKNDRKEELVILLPQYEQLICEGQTISIPNKNAVTLIVTSPKGHQTTIRAGEIIDYKTLEAGIYVISPISNSSKSTFLVKEASVLDFTINNEIKYENGIPSIPLETFSSGTVFEWSFENSSIKQYGTKAFAHFYTKGTYEVILKSVNNVGCESKVSKFITIDADYNLLAPSAFIPLSNDTRKNRFIPIALTLRNTTFKMSIIDPRTGITIYETTSIDGWDGINKNTNRLVEENQSYIWKVVLETPQPDEKREYSGVVTRL